MSEEWMYKEYRKLYIEEREKNINNETKKASKYAFSSFYDLIMVIFFIFISEYTDFIEFNEIVGIFLIYFLAQTLIGIIEYKHRKSIAKQDLKDLELIKVKNE